MSLSLVGGASKTIIVNTGRNPPTAIMPAPTLFKYAASIFRCSFRAALLIFFPLDCTISLTDSTKKPKGYAKYNIAIRRRIASCC